MTGAVVLSDGRVRAVVDLGRGAEITSLRHVESELELLLRTPWAEDALRRRPVQLSGPASSSEDEWMASYAGGWQTLFPHAGPPALVDGVEHPYHGEASSVAWTLDTVTDSVLSAHVQLATVPVHIERTVSVQDGRTIVADVLVNTSNAPVTYDYQSHPAFGAPFIDGTCVIDTEASRYIPDGRFDAGEFAPGVPIAWPDGGGIDLSRVPAPEARALRFGWLEGFARNRITIANPGRDIAVTLEWPDDGRRVAWLWQELHASQGPPWLGRGYAVALEPSTRTTEGASEHVPQLEPRGVVRFVTSLVVHRTASRDVPEGSEP